LSGRRARSSALAVCLGLAGCEIPAAPPRPAWVGGGAAGDEQGERRYRAVGSAEDEDRASAIRRAVAAGRAELAAIQGTSIQGSWEETVSAVGHIGPDGAAYGERTEITRALVSGASATLRGSTVEDVFVEPDPEGGWRAFARVGIDERELFPERRLRDLVDRGGVEQDFVALSREFEARRLTGLAELALLFGESQHPGLGLRRALMGFYMRSGWTARAVEWAQVLAACGEPEVEAEAADLLRRAAARQVDVDASAGELLALARARTDAAAFQVIGPRVRPGRVTVDWNWSRDAVYRILLTWVDDDELTPVWSCANDLQDRAVATLEIELDPAARPGELAIWALPVDSPVWVVAEPLLDRDLPRRGSVEPRLLQQLGDLLTQLRREADGVAAVVRIAP
jgi:hypothetical protein